MKVKQCKRCNAQKSRSKFFPQKGTKDGLRTICKLCTSAVAKIWRAENRERHNELIRVSKLRQRGAAITLAELEEMQQKQKNLCAICRQPETLVRINSKTSLSVDHCHATGVVRGLLCRRCNTGIANFDEGIDRLQAAIRYLRRSE